MKDHTIDYIFRSDGLQTASRPLCTMVAPAGFVVSDFHDGRETR